MRKSILLFMLLGCFIGAALSQVTCYLQPNGDDTGNCSVNQKCATITHCLTYYSNETQVSVYFDAGVYNNNCDIDVSNSNLTSLNIETTNSVTLDCSTTLSRHLKFANSPTLTVLINNINFIGGYSGDFGGCIFSQNIKSLSVRDSNFTQCKSQYGGAIYSNSSSTFLIDSLFQDNTASIGGGAVYVNGVVNGSNIINCLITRNTAEVGGGVYLVGDYLSFTSSNVSLNSASSYGGGLYIISDTPSNTAGAYNFQNSRFTNNSALLGGGLYAYNLDHSWNIFGALFEYNSVQSSNNTDSNVACGNGETAFCDSCVASDCSSNCAPSSGQSCSSNSTLALCYGSSKFKTCSTAGGCTCAPKGLGEAGKIIIALISLCLVVGVILIMVDVVKYLIKKRRSTGYTPL